MVRRICMCHQMCRRAEKTGGSEWWNEEVGGAVAEKITAVEEYLQRRDRVTYADPGHREWL